MVIIIYVSSLNSKEKKFARQREILPYRFQPLRCQDNSDPVMGCTPKTCGRYVSDNLITEEEHRLILSFAKAAFDVVEGDDSADFDVSKAEITTGKTTINLQKDLPDTTKDEIFSQEHMLALKLIKNRVLQSLADRFDLTRRNVHLTRNVILSRQTTLNHLDTYDTHRIIREVHPAVFYTTVVYLGDHGKDFKGGRMIFIEDPPTNKSITSVEGRKGRILGYTGGRENLQYVERITAGVQYQLSLQFTCDETEKLNDFWETN